MECFLRWSQQPEDDRTKQRNYPNIDRPEMFERGYVAAKSGHSRGGTVDLTLYDLGNGELAPMEACGFTAYEREWWHYTLTYEPYPNTYFDFPIA